MGSMHLGTARIVAGSALALTLAATGATAALAEGGQEAENATDSGGSIMVWVDPPRVPAAQAFAEAYPEIDFEWNPIEGGGNVGGTTLQQKFVLFNQAGEGWPDAIFFPSNDDIAWATSGKIEYARDLSELMSEYLEGYSEAANGPCQIDGGVRCVRNDQAPDVFWYNAKFFEENGYDVPATWEEYGELGVQIATEHPGMISGFLGDAYAPNRYLWASGCPTNNRLSETSVHIDMDDARCQRVLDLVDPMIEAGALTATGIFDTNAAIEGPGLVMSPGAVWWGNYLFRDTWKIPAAEMTAAPALRWAGEDPGFTGNEGGGLWGVSTHITGAQLENALLFAEFVTSDPRWQVELSTGMPAYGPAQEPWLAKQSGDAYFADFDGTAAAFSDAGDRVRDGHANMLYNTGGIWSQTVTPVLTAGDTLSDAWGAFGDRLINEAKTFGYEIVESEE
jgi:ABC-type glycerol-3-phosphate transport system substrate-binding protein